MVRIIHGIGFGFFHTSSFTFVATTALKAHRGQSLGYFALSSTISAALAPPIGMYIVNKISFASLFLICFFLSLCTIVIASQLEEKENGQLQNTSFKRKFFLDLKAIPPSITNSISLFMWGALTAFFPLYALNHGMKNPGLFFSIIAIMLILGRSFGGRILDVYKRENVIIPCLGAYFFSIAILAFSKTLPFFILVAIIWGTGNAFLMPSLMAYVLDRENSSPGISIGTFTAISDLGISLGPVIMGIVIHVGGYQTMFLSLALIGLINSIIFYIFSRKKG
jgi:predicted MFS family arabinose efflux permease